MSKNYERLKDACLSLSKKTGIKLGSTRGPQLDDLCRILTKSHLIEPTGLSTVIIFLFLGKLFYLLFCRTYLLIFPLTNDLKLRILRSYVLIFNEFDLSLWTICFLLIFNRLKNFVKFDGSLSTFSLFTRSIMKNLQFQLVL